MQSRRTKVVLAGQSGVGKTSIVCLFNNCDNSNASPTIGVAFHRRKISDRNGIVEMDIWDTAGQEKFKSLTTAYYKGADAILLTFDLTNRVTPRLKRII